MILRVLTSVRALVLVAALSASGCATTFTGDAKVPGGSRGCASMCAAQGLDFAGMVMMGEYSDGCICTTRGGTVSSAHAASAGTAAAAGVNMQMRQQQQAAARQYGR
jgi:hypothetical protein